MVGASDWPDHRVGVWLDMPIPVRRDQCRMDGCRLRTIRRRIQRACARAAAGLVSCAMLDRYVVCACARDDVNALDQRLDTFGIGYQRCCCKFAAARNTGLLDVMDTMAVGYGYAFVRASRRHAVCARALRQTARVGSVGSDIARSDGGYGRAHEIRRWRRLSMRARVRTVCTMRRRATCAQCGMHRICVRLLQLPLTVTSGSRIRWLCRTTGTRVVARACGRYARRASRLRGQCVSAGCVSNDGAGDDGYR